MAEQNKLWVIGRVGHGVLFVMLEPLRVVLVADEEIRRYASTSDIPSTYAYARVAASAWQLTADLSVEDVTPVDATTRGGIAALIGSGGVASNVDFAFTADVSSGSSADFNRFVYLPIEQPVRALSGDGGGLRLAVLSDTPVQTPS